MGVIHRIFGDARTLTKRGKIKGSNIDEKYCTADQSRRLAQYAEHYTPIYSRENVRVLVKSDIIEITGMVSSRTFHQSGAYFVYL